MIEEQVKLYCGFCGHQDTYIKRTWRGNGKKGNVSNAINCRKCGKKLNHKNKWE